MMKKNNKFLLRVVPLLVMLCLLLAGCGCKHQWNPATCDTPKTCSRCQITEGEALDHTWVDATTEAPKTCTVCQKTEGERIVTDVRFTTAACKELFGTWKGIYKCPGTFFDAKFTQTLDLEVSFIFNNDGSFQNIVKITNKDDFLQATEQFYIDKFYKEYADLGYMQAQADEAMKAKHGKDVKGYSQMLATDYDLPLFEHEDTGVYYVADGKVFIAEKWDNTLRPETYTIADNILTIDTISQAYPGIVLTKS